MHGPLSRLGFVSALASLLSLLPNAAGASGWQSAPEFPPPFHIAADGYGDLGARFVDLNGDGRQDFVFHRWIDGSYQQKGAYLSTGSGWRWAGEFTPPDRKSVV